MRHAAELVAVEVHRRAPAGRISMPLVYETIAQLCRHRGDCACTSCEAARKAKPEQV